MYLQRLVEFADEHSNTFPPLGYKRKKYHWIVDVQDGQMQFIPAIRGDEKVLPDRTRSSGDLPILLADKAEYVFGLASDKGNKKEVDRAKERQKAYLALLKECEEKTRVEAIRDIIATLQQPHLDLPSELEPNDTIVFCVNVDEFPHEDKRVQSFWQKYLEPVADEEDKMQCLVCGKMGLVMERHSIVFPIGKERTKLVSLNANAYESHGLKASNGSPTCYACEQKYGQALEYLLQQHQDPSLSGGPHMYRLKDLTYVYWLRKKKQITGINRLISLSVSNPDEVRELIQSVFSGVAKDSQLNDFCILTLSANKARMVVRGYEEKSLEQLQSNIERFFAAQDVNQGKLYGIYTLAGTMYSKPSSQMEKYAIAEWMNWMMYGRPLSNRVLIPLLKQIQAGGVMYSHHGAAIKSWLVSQFKGGTNLSAYEEQYNAARICGRLFAVLEKLQQDATNSKETIASRFFGSASTAPQSVFGLLIKNSQAHLSAIRKKKSKGAEVNYSKHIQDILNDLESFPTVLDLKGQAEFALGYYHERQLLFTAKEDKEGVVQNGL